MTFAETARQLRALENTIDADRQQAVDLRRRRIELAHRAQAKLEAETAVARHALVERQMAVHQAESRLRTLQAQMERTMERLARKDPNWVRQRDSYLQSPCPPQPALTHVQDYVQRMEQNLQHLRFCVGKLDNAFLPRSVADVAGRMLPGFRKGAYAQIARVWQALTADQKALNAQCRRTKTALVQQAAILSGDNAATRRYRAALEAITRQEQTHRRAQLEQLTGALAPFAALTGGSGARLCKVRLLLHPGAAQALQSLPGVAVVGSKTAAFDLRCKAPVGSVLLSRCEKENTAPYFAALVPELLAHQPEAKVYLADLQGLGSRYRVLAPLAETGSVEIWSTEAAVQAGITVLCRRVGQGGNPAPVYLLICGLRANVPKNMENDFDRLWQNAAKGNIGILADEAAAFCPMGMESLPFRRGVLSFSPRCRLQLSGQVDPRRLALVTEKLRSRSRVLPLAKMLPRQWQTEDSADGLHIPLGKDDSGRVVTLSLDQNHPYALIAGDVGSGKSSLLHTILLQLLTRYGPEQVQVAIGDFKEGTEFSRYAAPCPVRGVQAVVSEEDPDGLRAFLAYYVAAMHARRDCCRALEQRAGQPVRNYESYCRVRRDSGAGVPALPRLVLLVDEFQTLFQRTAATAPLLDELVRKGRTYGVHLIFASQRAVSDDPHNNFSGELKSYFTARIAFRCPQQVARTLFSDRAADTGREHTGIAAAPLLIPGQAVLNTGSGQCQAGTVTVQVSYADDSALQWVTHRLQEMNGPGTTEQPGTLGEVPVPNPSRLDLGASLCLFKDTGTPCQSPLHDRGTVWLDDTGHSLLVTGTDDRVWHSAAAALLRRLRAAGKSLTVLAPERTPLPDFLTASDITLCSDPEAQRRVMEREDTGAVLLLYPSAQPHLHRSFSALHPAPESTALEQALRSPCNGFWLVVEQKARALRECLPYAPGCLPLRLCAVGDSNDLRATVGESARLTPTGFDAPVPDAVRAYYADANTEKWGKVRLYPAR